MIFFIVSIVTFLCSSTSVGVGWAYLFMVLAVFEAVYDEHQKTKKWEEKYHELVKEIIKIRNEEDIDE